VAAFGVVWFLVTISPVSNTLFLSGVLLAERTLYLPSVGLAAATGWLIMRLARERPRASWVLLVAALALGSVRTWTRNPHWLSNSTVFAHMIGDNPHSGRSQWVLGDEFLRLESEPAALRAYSAAIGLLGQDYQLLTEISARLIRIERFRTAEFLLTQAWDADPSFPLAPALLAIIRAEHGDEEGAELNARRSLAIRDADPTSKHLLAWSLARQGRWEEAAVLRAEVEAEVMTGIWQQWMYDAYVLRRAGDTQGAEEAVDSAWARVATETGREALDAARVAEFGLPSLLGDRTDGEAPGAP
jgi:hypothetical protein